MRRLLDKVIWKNFIFYSFDQNGLLKESTDQFLIILQAQYDSKFLKEF